MSANLKELLQEVADSADFVEITAAADVVVDLKYASTDNFMKRNVYGDFNRAFLQVMAYEKFAKARQILKSQHPDLQFVIFDALRPRSVQWLLWNEVKGTDFQIYVADPAKGSIHNYGLALDIGLQRKGALLDMGTGFDAFTPLSQPKLEDQYLQQGKLQEIHLQNRKILRVCLESAGFEQLPHEWWHFNATTFKEATTKFKIVE